MRKKQISLLKWFDKAAERIMCLFPDWVTGNHEIMQQKYRVKYGEKDCTMIISQKKTKIMKVYLLIAAIFIVLICSSIIIQLLEGRAITSIQKPGYGEKGIILPVEVQMSYKGYEQTKSVNLRVKEKLLNEEEKREILHTYKDDLGRKILADNQDFLHVCKPLNLIDYESDQGISIVWTSDHPEILDKEGNVDLLEAKDRQEILLKAELTLDDVLITEYFRLQIDKAVSKEAYGQSINRRLLETIDQLTESNSSEKIQLPDVLEDGVEVQWYVGKTGNTALLIILFLFTILIVYFKRYDQINKEIKDGEASIIRDLPEFMNKLVLLLNAGLVVSTAFSKIVKDYEAFHQNETQLDIKRNKRYLYEELCVIQKKVDQSNASLIKELKQFAQRSGVRELVRLTAVISDNWNKGSMLVEKLEGESELLWIRRKKSAEEKGRLAETKLTFPLMILLIVLIMVTIAPAFMEM